MASTSELEAREESTSMPESAEHCREEDVEPTVVICVAFLDGSDLCGRVTTTMMTGGLVGPDLAWRKLADLPDPVEDTDTRRSVVLRVVVTVTVEWLDAAAAAFFRRMARAVTSSMRGAASFLPGVLVAYGLPRIDDDEDTRLVVVDGAWLLLADDTVDCGVIASESRLARVYFGMSGRSSANILNCWND